MKPTKEQLADPKWWNNNAKLKDKYCYMNEKTGECFTTRHFDDGVHGFELLAKRPEPIPSVGTKCMLKVGGQNREVEITYIGDGVGCYYDYKKGSEHTFSMRNVIFKKIKTQREELIGIVKLNLDMGIGPSGITEAILASFDLTEKDGE